MQLFALDSHCSKAKYCRNVLEPVLGQKKKLDTKPLLNSWLKNDEMSSFFKFNFAWKKFPASTKKLLLHILYDSANSNPQSHPNKLCSMYRFLSIRKTFFYWNHSVPKVKHPKYINIWKKVLTKAIYARQKLSRFLGFWQIILYIK